VTIDRTPGLRRSIDINSIATMLAVIAGK